MKSSTERVRTPKAERDEDEATAPMGIVKLSRPHRGQVSHTLSG